MNRSLQHVRTELRALAATLPHPSTQSADAPAAPHLQSASSSSLDAAPLTPILPGERVKRLLDTSSLGESLPVSIGGARDVPRTIPASVGGRTAKAAPEHLYPASVGGPSTQCGFADAAERLLNPGDACIFPLAIQDVLSPDHNAAVGPYVLSTRKGGKVHTQDGRTPGWSLCGWHFSNSAAHLICTSPFGANAHTAAPRCASCVAREPEESASGTDDSSASQAG